MLLVKERGSKMLVLKHIELLSLTYPLVVLLKLCGYRIVYYIGGGEKVRTIAYMLSDLVLAQDFHLKNYFRGSRRSYKELNLTGGNFVSVKKRLNDNCNGRLVHVSNGTKNKRVRNAIKSKYCDVVVYGEFACRYNEKEVRKIDDLTNEFLDDLIENYCGIYLSSRREGLSRIAMRFWYSGRAVYIDKDHESGMLDTFYEHGVRYIHEFEGLCHRFEVKNDSLDRLKRRLHDFGIPIDSRIYQMDLSKLLAGHINVSDNDILCCEISDIQKFEVNHHKVLYTVFRYTFLFKNRTHEFFEKFKV